MNDDKTEVATENGLDDATIISDADFNLETQTTFEGFDKTDVFINDNDIQTTNKLFIKNPIRELIEKYKLLSNDEIDSLIMHNNMNLEYIINSYLINVDKLYKLLATEFNMRFYNKIETLVTNINDDLIDISTQRKIGTLVVYMSTRDGNEEYFIIVSNPFDYSNIDYIKTLIPKDVKINFALSKNDIIKKTILKYMQDGDIKLEFSLEANSADQILSSSEIEDMQYSTNNDIPIIPLVNYIILNAHENRVSDIHIEPTSENMIVRYRIDGVLVTDINLPNSVHREVVSRIKIISDMNVAEKRLPQDGRFSIKNKNGQNLDLRISTFPTVYGEKVVLRLLEQDALKPKLEDLHLSSNQLEMFKSKIHASYGLVLITGPTGSGKTTTLYSALSSVDKDKLNVVTLENPVEYRLDGINQMQINETIGLTFASGLRTILRQDPDVIMLGEIRDLGTAQMAIRASLTGHMVFSTLHTNDAIGVIIRLVTMGIDPFLVASSVSLVVAQRLVRKICTHCASTYNLEELQNDLHRKGITKRRIEALNFDLEILPDFTYGKGCSYCRGSGYLGRQAIFEFFEFNDAIVAEILKKNIDENKIRVLAKEAQMQTLNQNSWNLVVEGTTTIEEVIRVIGE
jgi:type II secretory ATPase GspE/PulE/Tfp pilus assembly ATPase PilB-like protein